jgi:acetyl-CoA C-acetyltransferase
VNDPIVIASAVRTPIGVFLGDLAPMTAPQLGAAAIRAAVERAGIGSDAVDQVIMGNVLPAGTGQAPARQAALGAGLAPAAHCMTINKVCGSGMQAVMLAHDQIALERCEVAAAGGMESMSNAPYLLPKARSGLRLGHGEVKDHMFLDGLEDAYDKRLMGSYAEQCAEHYRFSRETQDRYAITSLARARAAAEDGSFEREIAPVNVSTRQSSTVIARDEQPFTADLDRIPLLKPAFRADGTVTAANSSSISDGAAAVVLMKRSRCDALGLRALARIVAFSVHSQEPRWFTTAPVGAIRKLLEKTGWDTGSIDLFEVNEAFAVVAMAAMRDLDIPHEKLNVHGGACALGHPLGASGARIMVTLLAALDKYDLKRGIASLCIGGGEATAIALERIT